MEALSCRLLPWAIADGATNMAADEALVQTAADAGMMSLRFYGWTPATLSLGYFQAAAVRASDRRLAPLPFVRRPSGGATLVHDCEVTYCLAVPAAIPGGPWMPRMHRIIAAALATLGVAANLTAAASVARHGDVLCFEQFTEGDLLCHGKKIVGSAQRKYRRALMQHGSILLARSEHTPTLPGVRELTGLHLEAESVAAVVADAWRRETGWSLHADTWRPEECASIATMVAQRYATREWNERR